MRDATHYAVVADVEVPVEQLAAFAAARLATVPLNPSAATGGDAVAVTANHGRWIVTCPDCGGALLAHPADRRFLCVDCGNVGNEGKYRRVIWPADHEEIGELLDARPDRALRNWQPGETTGDLRTENELLTAGPVLLEPPPSWADPKWHGHTHRYPRKADADGVKVCRDCGLPTHVDAFEAGS